MRRRLARHGIALAAALGAAVLLAACSTGTFGTASAPTATTGSTTPADALTSLESTLRQLGTAMPTLRTTLLVMEGSALNGGGTSTADIESATVPVVSLLKHAAGELESARGALPSSVGPQVDALAGALAKSLIDFDATNAMTGSSGSTPGLTAPTAATPSVSANTLASAYVTDLTELQASWGSAIVPFLAALGVPSR